MTATARVLEPTTLLVLDARQLVTLCEHNPRFGYEFMRRDGPGTLAAPECDQAATARCLSSRATRPPRAIGRSR